MGDGVIDKFIKDQLSVWPEAASAQRRLKSAKQRSLNVDGLEVAIQLNPSRIHSSTCDYGGDCSLCTQNRPSQQHFLPFEGRKGRKYEIIVNRFPIFPKHIVVVSTDHVPQVIWHRFRDMTDLAHHFPEFTFFYNGAKSGASIPGHLHFQACPRGLMPLERVADRLLGRICAARFRDGVPVGEEVPRVPEALKGDITFVTSLQEAQLYHYRHFTTGVFMLRGRTSKSVAGLFYRLLDSAPVEEGETEPRFNLLLWYAPTKKGSKRPAGYTHGSAGFEYRAVVIFRRCHRSTHFFTEGRRHLTMSPGCADMAGHFVVPRSEDYTKLDDRLLSEVVKEVSVSEEVERGIIWRLSRTQPTVQVGIMRGREICFEVISDGAGPQKVSYREGKIDYNGTLYDQLLFSARTKATLFAQPAFILHGVTIGKDFHWQREQSQTFAGSLKFIVEDKAVVAVNVIGAEDYLLGVIASEMRASAPLEYLKAHTVISRSWLMAAMSGRQHRGSPAAELSGLNSTPALVTWLDSRFSCGGEPEGEVIKWQGREDHKAYDVCADDHCQRYQGLGPVVSENVRRAVDETWGQTLMYRGEICDCRFSKCCGGMSESFSSCWEDIDYDYLPSLPDTPDHKPDMRAFCDTDDEAVLSQVLNDYDLEDRSFYRWKVQYSREKVSELLRRRSGIDFGRLESIEALQRGGSGRISKMLIRGSKKVLTVGKELTIRQWLSESTLRSSNFEPKWEGETLVLEGKGWGHGVGLCQIGAAVMSLKGYTYEEILRHYYPGAELSHEK